MLDVYNDLLNFFNCYLFEILNNNLIPNLLTTNEYDQDKYYYYSTVFFRNLLHRNKLQKSLIN